MFTLWFTGLPCSGKSTLAEALHAHFKRLGQKVELLDGDVIRTNLSSGLSFSKADRDANIRRVGFVCDLLSRNGVIAISACISPYRSVREELRASMGDRFVEIYVSAPLEECQARDVKGMYARARRGELKGFTGVDDPYEPPLSPDLEVPTHQLSLEASVQRILDHLKARV
ncbi:MAG: adenylyl-sulfate kinase [Candidatus Xenobia bacterium]